MRSRALRTHLWLSGRGVRSRPRGRTPAPLGIGAHVHAIRHEHHAPDSLAEVRREKAGRSLPAETDLLTGRQFLDAYLTPLAESETLFESLHLEEAVLQVGRAAHLKKAETGPTEERLPFRLLIAPAGARSASIQPT